MCSAAYRELVLTSARNTQSLANECRDTVRQGHARLCTAGCCTIELLKPHVAGCRLLLAYGDVPATEQHRLSRPHSEEQHQATRGTFNFERGS